MNKACESEQMRKKVLITGGEGFVGSHLITILEKAAVDFVIGTRKKTTKNRSAYRYCNLADELSIDLSDVKCVIHLAAHAHAKKSRAADFDIVNHVGTTKLAQQAVLHGVKQFIFLSSIGVLGNTSSQPLNEGACILAHNAYTHSKAEAEQSLIRLSKSKKIQITILRAPLVYGANAKGSFAHLVKLVKLGLPLPFASIQNKRSVCSINTLTECIYRCLCADSLGIKLSSLEFFNVADDEAVSTYQICKAIAKATNHPIRHFNFPQPLLSKLLCLLNKPELKASLLDDLLVDNTYMKQKLKWHSGAIGRNVENELIKMFSPNLVIQDGFK